MAGRASMQQFQPFRDWVRSHKIELALSVRVTAAALASLAIALALQLKLPLWAVFLLVYPPACVGLFGMTYLAFRWRWWRAGGSG